MSTCPFCNRDPFHYVDIGVGMQPVAVDCCELGDLFFRGQRPAPEEVTLSWQEFREVGSKLMASAAALGTWLEWAEDNLSEFDTDEPCTAEKLCPRCETSGCIKMKIDEARSALSTSIGDQT